MDKGLGQLGFWLAVGMVIAAMIVAGAIKERDKERDRQAALREDLERRSRTRDTLLEKAGENLPEVLAYLREKDAKAAANAEVAERRRNVNERQGLGFVAAFLVGMMSFMGGVIAIATQQRPPPFPRYAVSPETGRMILQPPPPPPTGLEAFLPVGMMLVIWAVGLMVAALIWWLVARQTHDSKPDA